MHILFNEDPKEYQPEESSLKLKTVLIICTLPVSTINMPRPTEKYLFGLLCFSDPKKYQGSENNP